MVLFNLLQKPFVFLQITEYILQVSMLCISFENSNKYCLTERERFIKLHSVETVLLANTLQKLLRVKSVISVNLYYITVL